jgi:hypothetical protein
MLASLLLGNELDSPQLADARRIAGLSNADRAVRNLEQEETRYQESVHEQTMTDLAQIYSPEHADRLQIAYASFTPESAAAPGADRGYGLHIVKRLDLPMPGGGTRTIYVNEQWPEDKNSKGLLLPDEIRIKTQVAAGDRRVKGSEKLYIFDSVRVAWGPHNREVQLARRTVYRRAGASNARVSRRRSRAASAISRRIVWPRPSWLPASTATTKPLSRTASSGCPPTGCGDSGSTSRTWSGPAWIAGRFNEQERR